MSVREVAPIDNHDGEVKTQSWEYAAMSAQSHRILFSCWLKGSKC